MGLLVTSARFNQSLRAAVDADFSGDNAWRLEMREDGKVSWIAAGKTLDSQPAGSFMQGLEDWFFSHLPIEGEL
jgi:putative cardiolipin synthase